jgi:YVTN family beta-propeller protein
LHRKLKHCSVSLNCNKNQWNESLLVEKRYFMKNHFILRQTVSTNWLSVTKIALVIALMSCMLTVNSLAQESKATPSYLLVLNKAENTLAIIEPQKFDILARIPTGEGPHEIIVSADSKTAFVANYGTQQTLGSSLSVIDLVARKEIRRVDLGALRRPHGIVEAGGKIYFTCEVNRLVARYDPATNSVDWIMGTGQNATHMLVVSPDQKKIYTANIASDTVTAMEFNAPPPAPSKITHIAVGKQPEGIALSPDARELWVGHNGDGKVSIIDTATNTVKETIQVGEVPIRVKFTPDGKRVLISDPKSGELIVFDAAARKQIKRIAVGETPVGILITPDGKRAFVATMQANRVAVINLEDLTVSNRIEPGKGPDGLAWAGN